MFRSITFTGSGYVLGGQNIALTAGITANASGASNTIDLNIALAASQTFECNTSSGILFVNGNIDLGSDRLTTFGAGVVHLGGLISGSGGVTKKGSGSLWMDGGVDNSYSGQTRVMEGTLELAKASHDAIPNGSLVIGDNLGAAQSAVVHERQDWQIGTIPITINADGKLDVGDYEDTVGTITFNGGTARSSATGLLKLGGTVTVNAGTGIALLAGNVDLNSATRLFDVGDANAGYDLSIHAILSHGGLKKIGIGALVLYGANNYAGETRLEEGSLVAKDDHSFGTMGGGVVVVGSGTLWLSNGVNVGGETLLFDRTVPGWAFRSYDNCSWAGNVVLGENAELEVISNSMDFSGVISGSGGLTKGGAGDLVFSGSTNNSYTGSTRILDGVLLLNKSGNAAAILNGALEIGDNSGALYSAVVREEKRWQIGTIPITINADGELDVGDYEDTVGAITFNGGTARSSATGLLKLGGTVTVNSGTGIALLAGNVFMGSGNRIFDVGNANVGYDLSVNAVLSGGSLQKTGEGQMVLYESNTYTGETTVDRGVLYVYDDQSLGTTDAGTTVSGAGSIVLGFSAHVGAEQLSLGRVVGGSVLRSSSDCSWTGNVVLGEDTEMEIISDSMEFSGAISGTGNLAINGPGTVVYSGSSTNTYTGDTHLNSGTLLLDKSTYNVSIPGNLYIGDGIGGADADVVRLATTSQIPNNTRIIIAGSGLFDMNNLTEYFGSLEGSGHVDMGGGDLGIGSDNSSSLFSGLIEGSGDLRKSGTGIFELSGNNTYSGDTKISAGTLLVNGSQPDSDIVVYSSGTLGGNGTVGAITSSGTVAPGASPGQLGCASTTLQPGSTFEVELDGYAPVDHDQLDVSGTATISNANLSIAWGFVPAVGDSFTILDNDGTDAVAGTFNGLAEGASVVAGNVTLQISYVGGSGNDVVLSATQVEELEPLRISAYTTVGGYVEMEWTGGVPFYVVEKKTSLTNDTWVAVSAPTRDMSTALPIDTTNSFYRVTGGN